MKRFAFVLSLVVAACSSKEPVDANPGIGDGGTDGGGLLPVPEWDKAVTAPSDTDAKAKRLGCGYAKGALPAETQGQSFPMGKNIPVDTIVIVMMENRSFDHYFAKLKDDGFTDVEVPPADFSNPDSSGKVVPIFHDKKYCFYDTNHEWAGSHDQVGADDKMQGFVKTNEGPALPGVPAEYTDGARAMGYYDKTDLPFMYWAAENFAIGDHYHCSLLGPTWPNRMYLYGASSYGRTENRVPSAPVENIIYDLLERRGVSWAAYAGISPGAAAGFPDRVVKYSDHVLPLEQYEADAAAGKLPQVAFVDAHIGKEGPAQDDEHPPADMQVGQQLLAKVTKALMTSPQWSRSALFITYDEHGGLFDHVPPPKACPPDANDPVGPDVTPGQKFDRYGMRVPFLVISPYAKKHYVGHHVYDHTSIVRFVEARFTLPAMTGRDANAEAPWDMFDFSAPNASRGDVPTVTVDAATLDKCKTYFAK